MAFCLRVLPRILFSHCFRAFSARVRTLGISVSRGISGFRYMLEQFKRTVGGKSLLSSLLPTRHIYGGDVILENFLLSVRCQAARKHVWWTGQHMGLGMAGIDGRTGAGFGISRWPQHIPPASAWTRSFPGSASDSTWRVGWARYRAAEGTESGAC